MEFKAQGQDSHTAASVRIYTVRVVSTREQQDGVCMCVCVCVCVCVIQI